MPVDESSSTVNESRLAIETSFFTSKESTCLASPMRSSPFTHVRSSSSNVSVPRMRPSRIVQDPWMRPSSDVLNAVLHNPQGDGVWLVALSPESGSARSEPVDKARCSRTTSSVTTCHSKRQMLIAPNYKQSA